MGKKVVEFTKEFATKKKGETGSYDSQLASELVNKKKVAKYVTKHKDIKE